MPRRAHGHERQPIEPRERKALKARAHALDPIIHLGGKGLTGAVLAEIDRALAAHELIKVRAGGMERAAREAALAEICARLDAQPVQHIGKVLVLYRERADAASAANPTSTVAARMR